MLVKRKHKKLFPVAFLLFFAHNGDMERKTKAKKAEYANFSIRLPSKLVRDIEAVAAKQNRTRNNMIEQLLSYAVEMALETHDPGPI